jgi:hypothetical protein
MNQTKSTPSTKATGASSSATAPAAATSTTASSSPCGCGCHAHGGQPCGCCKLTCFERPKYFCGQLLSDADLTLQETYFREKNKLYHRTMDGFGVVCGLQMRCDCHCKGHIVIGDGFAIDCCGNDLVVCEPRSFDVIGELRKKNCLTEPPREHRRPIGRRDEDTFQEPAEGEDDCIDKRCFYIGICYAEEPVDFATPYTTDCSPAPGPCQPTRIKECVRFEVYDELPVRPNPLDDIEKRIECCFRIFREGQFFRGLERLAPEIREILNCNEDQGGSGEWLHVAYHRFQELRAQFLHELRTCPDQYNCNLEHEVCRLRAPRGENDSGPTALEAFTALFELILQYVFSCVLAQFAFPCPAPSDPCCVLIGSVEVVNGRLTRVINYPRWYLLCFANFIEVLIYQLANEAACGRKEEPNSPALGPSKPRMSGCCPGFEVDVCTFLDLFRAEPRSLELAAKASVNAIRAMHKSLVSGFDFMKPGGVVASVFDGLPKEDAERLGRRLGLTIESLDKPPSERRDPLSALLSHLIHRGGDPLAAFESGKDQTLTGTTRFMSAPAWPIANRDAASLKEVQAMAERIQRLEDDLGKLRDSMPKPAGPEGGEGGSH